MFLERQWREISALAFLISRSLFHILIFFNFCFEFGELSKFETISAPLATAGNQISVEDT
jgi:hypothetical protein